MKIVNRVVIIINVGSMYILLNTKIWSVIHLGKNPIKGGIPLRFIKFIKKKILFIVDIFIVWVICFIVLKF